jgi:predicted TIM-barrel enzyme
VDTYNDSTVYSIKTVIGVIHVGALPGTPRSTQTVAELIALPDAKPRYTATVVLTVS